MNKTVDMICPTCSNVATCTFTNHDLKYPAGWTEICVWTQDPLHKAKVIRHPIYVCPDCYKRIENGESLEPTAEFHERVLQYNQFVREYIKGGLS